MLSLPVHGLASGSAPARGAGPLGTSRGTDRWAPPARRPELRRRATAPSRLVPRFLLPRFFLDRKSTRLNSSHVAISYALFCLPNKKNTATVLNRPLPYA